jgi:hypothetical protein
MSGSNFLCPIVVFFLLLGNGCGPTETPLYPAKGKLLIGGKPVQGLTIIFRLADTPPESAPTIIPQAITREDGTFVVATRKPDDGGPAGDYIITLADFQKGGLMGRGANAPDPFDAKYTDPKTSTLRATIKPVSVNEILLEVP